MTAKKRKPRKTQKPGSVLTVLLIIILLAILAAITSYFLTKQPTPITKTQSEQVKKGKEPQHKPTEKPSTKKPEVKTILEGTWVSRSDGALLEFHNNTFSIDIPSVDSHNFQKGLFSIEGAQITFLYPTGKTPCDVEKGVYTYDISDGSLHFKVEKDNCKSRQEKLVATWDRFSDQ